MMVDDKLCDEALAEWARTPAGRLFYIKLQKVVMSLPDRGAKGGALREHNARRRFAAELMAVMAERMTEPIGADSRDAESISERPIIFQLGRPGVVQPKQRRGARPRISDTGTWRDTKPDAPGPTNTG